MDYRILERYPKNKIFSDGTIVGPQGRPLKPAPARNGYSQVAVWDQADDAWHHRLVSRLVCEAFHGPAPTPKHEAAHGNGDHLDNRASNLRWATGAENSADRIIHGTDCKGSKHPQAKLTDEKVREIMALIDQGVPGSQIAREYGVQKAQISAIKHRRSWAHIPWPGPGEIKITMGKTTGKEPLTEMITLVLTPSMRAHLDHAAEQMGNAPYAYPARTAIARFLEEIDPLSPGQLATLTKNYLKNKPTKGQK